MTGKVPKIRSRARSNKTVRSALRLHRGGAQPPYSFGHTAAGEEGVFGS